MSTARIKKSSILVLCLLMTACASNKPADNLAHELDAILAEEFSADEPGGSILVKKGDKTVFLRSYGLADLVTKEKITENTLFNLGSISKTFVSNGILILKENGKLSLDDSISMYFDDFRNSDIAASVRINHLLSHTSGLPDNRNVDDNFEFFLSEKDEENFAPVKQADSLNFEPGEKSEYEKAIKHNVFLSKQLTDESRSVFRPENWHDTVNPFIGYSWYIGNEQMPGEENKFRVNFIYHKGDQGGFRAFYIVIPEKDIIYIGLFNRPPEDLDKIIKEGIYLLEGNKWLE